jgi:hypothetical protein
MKKPKKVLIVCYYWPPAGGPGVQRWLKFVKYLPEYGIEPIVYIPKNPEYPIIDNELLKEVPKHLQILKRPIREPYKWASMLSRKQTKNISSGIVPSEKKQTLLQKALLYIRGNYFVPDARVGWVKPSVKFLNKFIQEEEIETVITTGPPHSMHLIGLGLKEQLKTSLKWIADFRDPWTTIGYHSKLRMTVKTANRHKHLERIVLDSADKILVTSPTTKAEFQELTKSSIDVITNGFDVKENDQLSATRHFTIAHIGSLLSDRNPQVLWKVLSEITKRNSAFKTALKLAIVGRVSEEVIDSIRAFGLEDNLYLEGYIAHKDAIEMQRASNVLLLIEIDSQKTKSIIPGKLFEYLAARRPILAIGPEGSDIADIVHKTKSGSFHTYNAEDELQKTILTLFEHYQNKTEALINGDISAYHRKSLTKQLAQRIAE